MHDLGIGHRAPVMANGQAPGIRRQYDHSYALLLEEITMRRVYHYRRRMVISFEHARSHALTMMRYEA